LDEAGETEEEFGAEGAEEVASDEGAAEADEASQGGESEREGERRRRRRGRRGGRRNRMGREREGAPAQYEHDMQEREDEPHAFGSSEDLTAAPTTEADLTQAVTDLDAPAAEAPAPAEPADAAAAQASPPLPLQEPPRRRSTVREPAPIAAPSDAAPQQAPIQAPSSAPQPVVTEVGESESADRPRRSGWWSRRFAGG
jgi:ribonuclease E